MVRCDSRQIAFLTLIPFKMVGYFLERWTVRHSAQKNPDYNGLPTVQ
jgi:hypothetical protein